MGIILTLIARNYAVTQRLAMGLTPGWGGEFFIIPLMIIWYSILKADWSLDDENERSYVRIQGLAEKA